MDASDNSKWKVSVVVAVYNAGKYLRQCMDSITGQTLREIEIICVNDGSSDNSLSILKEYEQRDSRIRVFSKENEGLGGASARNFGLERARGEYVSILDSDDFFEPEMLEKAVKRAEETAADIVVFGGCEYDEANKTTRRVSSILNRGVIPEPEVFSCHDCPGSVFQLSQGMAWNKLYRRSFLDKHGLRFQKIRYTDDAWFTFSHMVLAERITVLAEDLCYYRVNSGTNQTGGIDGYPDSSYVPYMTLRESLMKWGLYEEVKQSFVNCAAVFIRYCYDMIGSYAAFTCLHEKLRGEILDALDIGKAGEAYFYDRKVYQWVRQVKEYPAGELAFRAARAYGGDSTTGILRFRFPYERIPGGSRVVILGSDKLTRYYYAQALMSGYCRLADWPGEIEPQEIRDRLGYTDFDYAIVAYLSGEQNAEAAARLETMGVPRKNIISGGNVS